MKTRLMGWVAVAALGGVSLMGCEKPAEQEAPVQEKATAEVAVSEPVEIVVYSSRKEHLIKPLFDKYTAETGTKISYITDKDFVHHRQRRPLDGAPGSRRRAYPR